MKILKLLIWLPIMILAFTPSRFGAAADSPVVFGGSNHFPPFHFQSESGEALGFDTDLFRRIAGEADWSVRFRFGEWDQVQDELSAGTVDVVPMFESPERSREYLFSDPILVEDHFLFGPETDLSHRDLTTLSGFTIAAEQGGYALQELRALDIDLRVLAAPSETEAMLSVAQGDADLALIPARAGRFIIDTHGLDEMTTLSPPLLPVIYAFAVNPRRPDLLTAINSALADLQRQGVTQQLERQWLSPAAAGSSPFGTGFWLVLPLALMTVLAVTGLYIYRNKSLQIYREYLSQNALLQSSRQESRELSERDGLTNMLRRKYFLREIDQSLSPPLFENQRCAITIIALRDIEYIQHVAGYAIADNLISQVASVLRETEPLTGYLDQGHYVVFHPDILDRDDALQRAQVLIDRVGGEYKLKGIPVNIEITGGICVSEEPGVQTADLLRKAEVALSAAKKRNRLCLLYEESMDFNPLHLTLMTDLRKALANDGITWVYQPQYDVDEQRITSAEMLIRWDHPEHGWIPPDQFIPMAEQTGLILQVTREVIRRALTTLGQWNAGKNACRLSINVSANDLAERDNVAFMMEGLEDYGRYLTLEITETAIMQDVDTVIANVEKLKKHGVKISLDDYGTGYASLDNLKQFNFDEIKIDRSFIKNITRSERDLKLTRSCIGLGHDLGAIVVAEGVEEVEAAQLLIDLGCDMLQGYFISHPLPAEDFLRFQARDNTIHKLLQYSSSPTGKYGARKPLR